MDGVVLGFDDAVLRFDVALQRVDDACLFLQFLPEVMAVDGWILHTHLLLLQALSDFVRLKHCQPEQDAKLCKEMQICF